MSCKCHDCGKQYKVDIWVPEELWKKIGMDENGMLCGSCIMKKIEELDEYDYWDLVKVN